MAMVVCLFLSYKGVHQLWKCPHPAALALLLSPHCAAAGPLVLVPICRTDTKVLCKPRSTCSLSLCMIWMAQEMVLEAGDSEYLLSPTTCFCGLWDAEKQMASWKWHRVSLQVIWCGGQCHTLQWVGKMNTVGQGMLCTRPMPHTARNTVSCALPCSAQVPDLEPHPLA